VGMLFERLCEKTVSVHLKSELFNTEIKTTVCVILCMCDDVHVYRGEERGTMERPSSCHVSVGLEWVAMQVVVLILHPVRIRSSVLCF